MRAQRTRSVALIASLLSLMIHPSYGQQVPFTFGLTNFLSWLPSAAAQTTQPTQPAQTTQVTPPPPTPSEQKPAELDCRTEAQSSSPPDGNQRLQVVQDAATRWQPIGGTTHFTIKGKDLSPGKFQVVACFRWNADDSWKRTEPLQVISANDEEITFGAMLTNDALVKLNENTADKKAPSWFCDAVPGWKQAFKMACAGRLTAQYDGMGFVPVAEMRILAHGQGSWKVLDTNLPVGVTSHWVALLTAFFCIGLAWWIMLKLAKARADIQGGPFIRVITNRNGYASLSQFQITLWTFVIAGGAIYVMALSGALIDVPAQALTLLGISGATILAASLPGATASTSAPPPAANTPTPGIVSGLSTVGAVNDTSVVLSWRAPATGTTAAAYFVERGDAAGANWTRIAGTSDPFLAITNLNPNTAYQFRVIAVDDQGTPGNASPSFPVRTPAAALGAAPAALGNLRAATLNGTPGESGISVTWQAPAGAAPDGYLVQYRESPAGPWISAAGPIFTFGYPVTGLSQNTTYDFRVAAIGNGAIGQWTTNPVSASTNRHKPSYADLIIWDGRKEIDVTRIQMLLFTVIAGAFVLLQIWRDSAIPAIPAGMLVLMGISNGVYLTAKFIPPQR